MRSVFYCVLIIFIFISVTHSFADNNKYKPKTYEEAYNLAYDLVINKPDEAIEVIRYINNQNIPVKENDIFFVNSIAALALRPIFRETKIGINLLDKIVKIKPNDYQSNAILYTIYASKLSYNPEKAKKYAINLLDADYKSYIKSMDSVSPEKSSLSVVRNYKDNMIIIYEHIYTFFMQLGESNRAKRAKDIASDIIG
jgi:hypothetical protein